MPYRCRVEDFYHVRWKLNACNQYKSLWLTSSWTCLTAFSPYIMEQCAEHQELRCLSVSRARSSVHTEPDEGSVSISMLNRHIHTLRKRIRHFEERFEQEKHYKVREGMWAAWSAAFSWVSWVWSSVLPFSSRSHRAMAEIFQLFFLFFVCMHVWLGVNYLCLSSKMMLRMLRTNIML